MTNEEIYKKFCELNIPHNDYRPLFPCVEVGFGNCLPCPVCGYNSWATFDEFKDEMEKTE